MTKLNGCHVVVAMAIFAVTCSSSGAFAQPGREDVEALIEASLGVDSGLALARRQAEAGDLPGAAATLERITITHPEAVAPRLLYASLLCRLDDREGADVELKLMAGQAIAEDSWAEVTSACGAVARPAPPRGSRR